MQIDDKLNDQWVVRASDEQGRSRKRDADMNRFSSLIVAAAFTAFGGAAQAALVTSDDLTCAATGDNASCSPASALLSPGGVEFALFSPTFTDINLSSTGVTVTYNSAFSYSSPSSFTIGDLDFIGGEVLLGITSFVDGGLFSGLNSGDVSTTENSFTVDLTGVSSASSAPTFSFDFVSGPATVVPLPAAIWMLGGALFLLGASRRFTATA